jgi:hypothetical protein
MTASSTTVASPSDAAQTAAARPAGPAPRMTTSQVPACGRVRKPNVAMRSAGTGRRAPCRRSTRPPAARRFRRRSRGAVAGPPRSRRRRTGTARRRAAARREADGSGPTAAGRLRRAGDPDRGKGGLPGLVPGREELGHRRIQDAFGVPGDPQMVVDLAQGHRGHGRVRRRPVAPRNEQDAFGTRMQIMRAGQEIDRGHRQVLVGGRQRDDTAGIREISQHCQRGAGRGRANDLVVDGVAAV